MSNVKTKPVTKEYEEGWDRIFGTEFKLGMMPIKWMTQKELEKLYPKNLRRQ